MALLSICIVLSRPPSLPTAMTPLGSISFPGSFSGFVRLQKQASTSRQPKWCMAILWLSQLNSSLRLLQPTSVASNKSWGSLLPSEQLIAPAGRPTSLRIFHPRPTSLSELTVIADLSLRLIQAHKKSSSNAQRHFSVANKTGHLSKIDN